MAVNPTKSSDSTFREVKNSFKCMAKWLNHQCGAVTLLRLHSSYTPDHDSLSKEHISGRREYHSSRVRVA
jgi:hypothetical protein